VWGRAFGGAGVVRDAIQPVSADLPGPARVLDGTPALNSG
jgi:hypothetical protein